MKKFYAFLFAAVALVGFAACNSDSTEEPAPAGVEKVSFTANIDNTKTDLAGLQTIWCEGDVVMIDGFEFVCGNDLATFTCTDDGCTSLLNKVVTAVYSNKGDNQIDSEAGVHGALLTATGTLTAEGDSFNFAVQNAFLKLTTTGTVTLKADQAIFSTGTEYTIKGENKEAVYVAINPLGDVKLSCESFGKEVKPETNVTLDVKKIYNLGDLKAATFTVYVTPQPKSSAAEWTTVNLYAWDVDPIVTWPGQDITANTEVINGYTYYKYTFPAEYSGEAMNVIVNNGSAQTPDIELGTLDKDYFVVYSVSMKEVYTEAPAAGSIEEYVAPTEKTIYLQAGVWDQASAYFEAWVWGSTKSDAWYKFNATGENGIYSATIPSDATGMKILRKSPSHASNSWDSWNDSGDQTIPTDGKNMFIVKDWNDYSWGTK